MPLYSRRLTHDLICQLTPVQHAIKHVERPEGVGRKKSQYRSANPQCQKSSKNVVVLRSNKRHSPRSKMICGSRWWWCRCCPHKTETSHKTLRQIRWANRVIVLTRSMHLMSKTQSEVYPLHQTFQPSQTLLQEFPAVCFLITWREQAFQCRRHNRKSQCRANVGIFSSSNKLYQTQVESRVRCRIDQYTIQVNIYHWHSGFRQVVTHVQQQQKRWIVACKAVNSSIASKALVMDYILCDIAIITSTMYTKANPQPFGRRGTWDLLVHHVTIAASYLGGNRSAASYPCTFFPSNAFMAFFFRPTPSWLLPGRSTCFIACCK